MGTAKDGCPYCGGPKLEEVSGSYTQWLCLTVWCAGAAHAAQSHLCARETTAGLLVEPERKVMSPDKYEAAGRVAEALGGLSEDEVKKAVLMALVGIDRDGLLVDPAEIMVSRPLGRDPC